MAKVPNAVEILLKISTASVGCMMHYRRQTDGRAIAYSEREHEFTFANKNQTSFSRVMITNVLSRFL